MPMSVGYINEIADSGASLITHIGLIDGLGREVSGGTYARQSVAWTAASLGTVRSTADLEFNIPAGISVSGWRCFSALSGGSNYGGESLPIETYSEDGEYKLLASSMGISFGGAGVDGGDYIMMGDWVDKTGDEMTGELNVPSVRTGNHIIKEFKHAEEDGGAELGDIEHDGEDFTIFQITAPQRDDGHGHHEATLALMRHLDPDTGRPEFLDLYNMNYEDGKQMGIRVQTRGAEGVLRDFVFDFNRGDGVYEVLRIKPDKSVHHTGNSVYKSYLDQQIRFEDEEGNLKGGILKISEGSNPRVLIENSVAESSVSLNDNGSTVFYSPSGDFYVYLDVGQMFINDDVVQTRDFTTLKSPDGSIWKATITDAGVVSWTKQS